MSQLIVCAELKDKTVFVFGFIFAVLIGLCEFRGKF